MERIPSQVVIVAATAVLPPRPASHLLGRANVCGSGARRDVLGVTVLVHLDDGRVGTARAAVKAAFLPERAAVVPESKLEIAGNLLQPEREGGMRNLLWRAFAGQTGLCRSSVKANI